MFVISRFNWSRVGNYSSLAKGPGILVSISVFNSYICRKSIYLGESETHETNPNNYNSNSSSSPRQLSKRYENLKISISKPKNKRKFHQQAIRYKNTVTATMLDWRLCAIQTDAKPVACNVVRFSHKSWNHLIRSINGNRSGKVQKSLTVMYQNLPCTLNVTSLGTLLGSLVERLSPDILFVGEANSEDVRVACPGGYAWLSGHQKVNREDVRVSALVRETVKFKVKKIKTKVPAVGVKVGQWLLVGAYREWAECGDQTQKSRAQQEARLRDFADYWLKIKGKTAILGDFNFDPCVDNDYQKSLEYLRTIINDSILPLGWRQIVRGKTRFEPDKAPAQLDHIYLNRVDTLLRTWNENCSGTDHNLVGLRIQIEGSVFKSKKIEVRDLHKVTQAEFRSVWEENESDIYEEKDPTRCLILWEYNFHRTLDTVAPKRIVITRANYNPWFTKELGDLCRERDRRKKESQLYRTKEAKANFKVFRTMVTNKLNKAKFDWNREHLNVTDSKKMWSRIKRMAGLNKKETEEMTIKVGDEVITDKKELASFMNKFFKRKVEKLQENLKVDKEACLDFTREYMANKKVRRFNFQTVGTGEVMKTIAKLKNTGAEGRDSISTKVLKQFKSIISPTLRHIINQSIRKNIFPDGWKTGLLSPLPKAGDLTDPKNWRPICINCAASKCLESVLQRQLQAHMEDEKVFSRSQHAYRSSRSTESALLDLDTLVQKGRNEGKTIAGVLTDMSAAFNLIDRDILVSQMKEYGVMEESRDLVRSYLTNRRTRCRMGDEVSEEVTLESGVGEGSVLGPLYFVCGLNPISIIARRTERAMAAQHKWVEVQTLEFADDSSGIITADNEEELQEAVNIMFDLFVKFMGSIGMALNWKKCELIIFRSHEKKLTLTLPGGQEEVSKVKLLGLHIDSHYRFTSHCQAVCNKLRFKIANLNRVRPYLTQERAKLITEALVLSVIDYAGTLYLRLTSNCRKVQKLINSAARSILKAGKRTHIEEMLLELFWLNSVNRQEFLLVSTMRRMKKLLMIAPVTYTEIFINRVPKMPKLKNSTHIRVQWPRLNSHGHNSYCVRATSAFNKYDLAKIYFASEEDFKFRAKLKCFSMNPNGNV